MARSLWATLEFDDQAGKPLLEHMQGRWSHLPTPQAGDPFEAPQFTQIDIPPNLRPEPLDVAVRFEGDGATFGMNSRNLFSGGRHDIFEIQTPFKVEIRIRGEGALTSVASGSAVKESSG